MTATMALPGEPQTDYNNQPPIWELLGTLAVYMHITSMCIVYVQCSLLLCVVCVCSIIVSTDGMTCSIGNHTSIFSGGALFNTLVHLPKTRFQPHLCSFH